MNDVPRIAQRWIPFEVVRTANNCAGWGYFRAAGGDGASSSGVGWFPSGDIGVWQNSDAIGMRAVPEEGHTSAPGRREYLDDRAWSSVAENPAAR
jgi:hypothetical protein